MPENKILDYESFKRVFPKKLYKRLISNIVPYGKIKDKNDILLELHTEINNYTYSPSICHEYLVFNKQNGIIRISPIFSIKDSFLYYFCIKMIEDKIAKNRVEGTYGGWRLGNKIRFMEDNDKFVLSDYAPSGSYNPFLWSENWKDFQEKAHLSSKTGNYRYILKVDIANFYHTISLHLLEKKLYLSVPKEKVFYVELLMHFLRNWNKKMEGFSANYFGLPEESTLDCSRLLANFYLQDYDFYMKDLCDKLNAKFLRYTDDQIIFAPNKKSADKIIFEASKFLSKIGLNFNSNKAKAFTSMDEFETYWAFEIFILLDNLSDTDNINKAIEIFLDLVERGIDFKKDSVLKRILNLNFELIKEENLKKLMPLIYNKDFLSMADAWRLDRVYTNLDDNGKKEFLIILDELVDSILYNSYHYNLVNFYKLNNIKFDETRIKRKVEELRI